MCFHLSYDLKFDSLIIKHFSSNQEATRVSRIWKQQYRWKLCSRGWRWQHQQPCGHSWPTRWQHQQSKHWGSSTAWIDAIHRTTEKVSLTLVINGIQSNLVIQSFNCRNTSVIADFHCMLHHFVIIAHRQPICYNPTDERTLFCLY